MNKLLSFSAEQLSSALCVLAIYKKVYFYVNYYILSVFYVKRGKTLWISKYRHAIITRGLKKVIYIKVHISVVYPPIKHNLLFLSGIKSRRIFTHSQLLYIVWLCIGM